MASMAAPTTSKLYACAYCFIDWPAATKIKPFTGFLKTERPGAYIMCFDCAGMCRVTDDKDVRQITAEEIASLLAWHSFELGEMVGEAIAKLTRKRGPDIDRWPSAGAWFAFVRTVAPTYMRLLK